MNLKGGLSTFLPVGAITVLVWLWAAGETRNSREITLNVFFSVPKSDEWHVTPSLQSVKVTVNGSNAALARANELNGDTIVVELSATPGEQRVNVVLELDDLKDIEDTGCSVTGAVLQGALTAEDQLGVVYVDPIITRPGRIQTDLRGVAVDAEVEIDPPTVAVRLPSRLDTEGQITVSAQPDRFELEQLKPGETKVLTGSIILPQNLRTEDGVSVSQGTVQMTFRVRSQEREETLPTVRVHLDSPQEDNERYQIEIDPASRTLEDVTITARAEVIDRILSGEMKVRAFVVLTSAEKEAATLSADQGTITKPVAWFTAVDSENPAASQQVRASVNGGPPQINLTVFKRVPAPE